MAPAPEAGGVFALMNVVGLVAFAMVGSLKAADADLDLFGVAVLGVLTALGGGTVRDVLVGRVPGALRSTGDVAVALLGVALAVLLARRVRGRLLDHPLLLAPDAVGLAAFAATGALVGHEAGLSPFGVVALATLTAVGGGSLADVLLSRVPVVLREEFYATPAVLGGALFWLAESVGVDPSAAALGCAGLVLGVRLLALRRGWDLPSP
ncbi:trimeric intracellular cation channel family protein [Halobium salinum]|uniref:Trimeric intracellular cation channel family protein n=1 Tax=Halobium salinum TaxID=1364940 RepID=A0ABD5PGS1_9EURY|nr:trimeric intracellular cation channel family protein [Halobium salinum]